MFIAVLFTIAKLWELPRCPTSDEWIKKMWDLYTTEFYSAMKNYILSFTNKWMARLGRLRRPKFICSPSHVDFRLRANAAILLDLGHILRGEHISEVRG
jgi:hypothetical protein